MVNIKLLNQWQEYQTTADQVAQAFRCEVVETWSDSSSPVVAPKPSPHTIVQADFSKSENTCLYMYISTKDSLLKNRFEGLGLDWGAVVA